jgi:hypothetical protein
MRLDEILTEDQLDEINWKKGLATAATAGAMALGSHGASAQNATWSPANLDTRLAQSQQQLDKTVKNFDKAASLNKFATSLNIVNGLRAIGDAIQNDKYKTQATNIMNSGPWKIFKGQKEGFGELTIVYGSGKLAVLMGNLVGTYDETSPGVVDKGRIVIDLNNGVFKTKSMWGNEDTTKLQLVQSSPEEQPNDEPK